VAVIPKLSFLSMISVDFSLSSEPNPRIIPMYWIVSASSSAYTTPKDIQFCLSVPILRPFASLSLFLSVSYRPASLSPLLMHIVTRLKEPFNRSIRRWWQHSPLCLMSSLPISSFMPRNSVQMLLI
jgi:hypothetical protein